MDHFDAIVIGAGFGGLGAALHLAERGAKVALLEALTYPGGCASTHTRRGHRFESGATLFAGFDEGQLFHRWIARHSLPVETLRLDPVITFRAPGLTLAVPSTRAAFVERLCALPGAPGAKVHAFFAEQGAVADALWASFDDPGALPPFAPGALAKHLARATRYLPLARLLGRPLSAVLARHGLLDWRPLTALLDGLCQITVQAPTAEAEAPLALAALDFPFRGARHVVGGIGRLAEAMCGTVEASGGTVRMACRAKRLARDSDTWRVETRDGVLHAPVVIANMLPQSIPDLAPEARAAVAPLTARVEESWGAAMLYLVLRGELPPEPFHLELVQDLDRPFREGNHLFCSVGAAAEAGADGARTATVSTHLPMPRGGLPDAATVARVQAHMREGLRRLAPEIDAAVVAVHPASPRTFARFTRRPNGLVGGVPRRAGLGHYRDLWPRPVLPGLWLVGDSVFPGQSTLATAIGGIKVAEAAWGG